MAKRGRSLAFSQHGAGALDAATAAKQAPHHSSRAELERQRA